VQPAAIETGKTREVAAIRGNGEGMEVEADCRSTLRRDQLVDLSKHLDEAMKELRAELEVVEKELNLTAIGREIEVEGTLSIAQTVDQDSDTVMFEARLAFGSNNGRARILVRSYTADDPDIGITEVDGTDQPLLESSADQRAKAVTSGALDELLGLVGRRAEKLLRDTLKATTRLREGTPASSLISSSRGGCAS
jgi:hypothetical protein